MTESFSGQVHERAFAMGQEDPSAVLPAKTSASMNAGRPSAPAPPWRRSASPVAGPLGCSSPLQAGRSSIAG
jgi:hypothetical protein